MAQIIWYLKIQDNLVKYKDRFFKPTKYLNLKEYIEDIAGSALGTNINVTSGTITSNYSLSAGHTMRITTAKTTAGGKGLLSIKVQRT